MLTGDPGSSTGKHWFGNSSALDSFLASNSPEAQDGAADSAGGSTSVNKASGMVTNPVFVWPTLYWQKNH